VIVLQYFETETPILTEPTLEFGPDINIKRHELTTWGLKDLPHIPMKNEQSVAED